MEISSLQMMEMMCLVMRDTLPVPDYFLFFSADAPADALFFHSRSLDDEDGMLEGAAELHSRRLVRKIVLSGHDGINVVTGEKMWAGSDSWRGRLMGLGVPEQDIITVPVQARIHTKAESDAYVQHAARSEYESAVIWTQPHQALRAMMGTIKAAQEQNSTLLAWSASPLSCDWWKQVHGSQGQMHKIRFQHIADEHKRIEIYIENSGLCSPAELVDYYQRRNAPR